MIRVIVVRVRVRVRVRVWVWFRVRFTFVVRPTYYQIGDLNESLEKLIVSDRDDLSE